MFGTYSQCLCWAHIHRMVYVTTFDNNSSKLTEQYHRTVYNTIQYNTIQYNTIQYNTIQYNTIQYKSLYRVPHSTKVGVIGGPVYKLTTLIKIKFGCSVTKPPGLCRSQTAN